MNEVRDYTIKGTDGTDYRGEVTIQSHEVDGNTFYFVSFDHEYWTGGDWAQFRRTEILQGGPPRDARAYAEGWLSSWGEVTIFPAK